MRGKPRYILKRLMDVWKTTVYINRADGCMDIVRLHCVPLCTDLSILTHSCLWRPFPNTLNNYKDLSADVLSLSELRSCVKIEVAVLGSASLIVLVVSVDEKQH